MGELCMVIGKSGSGKSTSLRNFEADEVGIFSCAGKRLPFKKDLKPYDTRDYRVIEKTLASGKRRAYVIDDSTYLMQFALFDHAKEAGYGKFTEIALQFEKLLEAAHKAPSDTITYFLHHPSFDETQGTKPQTAGKMLDNQLNIEGLFPIVIECRVTDGRHEFITENDGSNVAKSPVDVVSGERMLPPVMDNDLKAVDTAIRAFWSMPPLKASK